MRMAIDSIREMKSFCWFEKITARVFLFSVFCFLFSTMSFAQEERGLTRDGNSLFDKGKYSDAEAAYKKALDKKNNFPEAIFNLGDAVYKQQRYEDATKQFQLSAKTLTDTKQKAGAFHNIGNTYLEQKKYEEAVTAFKQSLKINPNDKDTKYNLAYANAMLKQKNQDDKNKQQNKDQKKDDKDKKDNKDDKGNQDKKDQQDKDGKGDQNKDGKQEPKKGNRQELSKEAADKLLEALKNEEQKTQQKMQQKMGKPQEVKIEKDW